MHVLYLEDDPIDAEAFRRALARLRPGVTLEICNTPSDALRLVQEHKLGDAYDVLVVDVSLPEMTGFEFLERMKAQRASGFGTRVVVFTSSEHRFDLEEAHRARADAYVVKTADPSCFEALVVALGSTVCPILSATQATSSIVA